MAIARRIGTFDISAEPFHDCCSILLPRSPALYASRGDLDQAEAGLNVPELVNLGMNATVVERYSYSEGKVERAEGTQPATTLATRAIRQDEPSSMQLRGFHSRSPSRTELE